jgi:glycosyltransferase involved in cell wall biosynthesis
MNNSKIDIDRKKPVISIIVPVYFEEKIIADTLSTYPAGLLEKYNAELIVTDGGSTDDTIRIASQFTDKIVVHNEERRQTIAEGRNKGAEEAKGEVLVFINGDTLPADPELFFKRIEYWFQQNSKDGRSIALACPVSIRDSEKLFKDSVFYFLHNTYVQMLNFIGMGMGRGECQIVLAEYFKKVGGYNSALTAGEDFDLFRRLAKIGKIKFAKDILVYESPRRFRKYGYLRILMSWLLNSISVMFYNRSVSKDWEAVR